MFLIFKLIIAETMKKKVHKNKFEILSFIHKKSI